MDVNTKKSALCFIDNLLTLKSWHDVSEPILFQDKASGESKSLNDYFCNDVALAEACEASNTKLLFETLIAYDTAIEDDWLPDTLLGLSTKKAYYFLNEIKRLLENKPLSSSLEEALIQSYTKVKDEVYS